ncbi:MAG: SMP-30/gluconolactonase/LRE family protein [Pseudoxanthomonas sp.]
MSRADASNAPPAALAFDVRCALGESIVWCSHERALWWTDIESRRIWRHRTGDASGQWWSTPGRVGSLALCESGRLLLGMEDGLFLADPERHAAGAALPCERICRVPVEAAMRINDGRADRSGNFVFGTLNEDPARARTGRFYQYSARHGLRRLELDAVAIANGICFEADGAGMYYCDSLQRRIMRVRYAAATASVSSPRVFADVEEPGEPDGAVVDAAGNVWSAQWGAARLACHSPSGKVERVLPLPVSQPTCPTFAGDGLDVMFIATARTGLDESQLLAQPSAGGVFAARVEGARGLVEPRFADA